MYSSPLLSCVRQYFAATPFIVWIGDRQDAPGSLCKAEIIYKSTSMYSMFVVIGGINANYVVERERQYRAVGGSNVADVVMQREHRRSHCPTVKMISSQKYKSYHLTTLHFFNANVVPHSRLSLTHITDKRSNNNHTDFLNLSRI